MAEMDESKPTKQPSSSSVSISSSSDSDTGSNSDASAEKAETQPKAETQKAGLPSETQPEAETPEAGPQVPDAEEQTHGALVSELSSDGEACQRITECMASQCVKFMG